VLEAAMQNVSEQRDVDTPPVHEQPSLFGDIFRRMQDFPDEDRPAAAEQYLEDVMDNRPVPEIENELCDPEAYEPHTCLEDILATVSRGQTAT
jgi:hypothetical protein